VNLFDKRFVINTGKGGVGQSTISAAMALAAARRGKRVLAIELNTRERISRLFGAPEVGSEIKPIHENVWAVNITPDAAMKEYVLMKLRIEMVYRAVFENRFVKQFLRVIPGLTELVLIGKAWYHEQERDKRGRPVYDFIVVDAPATGHGIFFLKIPHVITEAVPTGPMSAESRKILDLLQDPQRTALNLITLMEEMPVNETIELRQVVDATLDIPMGYLIANGIYPRLFTAKEASQLELLVDAHPERDLTCRLLEMSIFRSQRNALQEGYLDRLDREVGMPLIEVPYYFESELDFEVISRIASHIEESVERRAARPA
jgi:cellulose biosynthesis protein BcsQ